MTGVFPASKNHARHCFWISFSNLAQEANVILAIWEGVLGIKALVNEGLVVGKEITGEKDLRGSVEGV